MLSRLTNVIIGTILFAGITLVDYFASNSSLTLVSVNVQSSVEKYKYIYYFAIISIYIAEQLFRDLPKPVSVAAIEEFRPFIRQYLEAAIDNYSNDLIRLGSELPVVRMNVMLKVRKNIFMRSKLKIIYTLGFTLKEDENGWLSATYIEPVFSGEELAMAWDRGQGACGEAYQNYRITIWDSKDPRYKSPSTHLSEEQKKLTNDLNSIISLPLWLNNKIIGILNVDSIENIPVTKFNEHLLFDKLDDYADSIALLCSYFKDGILLEAL